MFIVNNISLCKYLTTIRSCYTQTSAPLSWCFIPFYSLQMDWHLACIEGQSANLMSWCFLLRFPLVSTLVEDQALLQENPLTLCLCLGGSVGSITICLLAVVCTPGPLSVDCDRMSAPHQHERGWREAGAQLRSQPLHPWQWCSQAVAGRQRHCITDGSGVSPTISIRSSPPTTTPRLTVRRFWSRTGMMDGRSPWRWRHQPNTSVNIYDDRRLFWSVPMF